MYITLRYYTYILIKRGKKMNKYKIDPTAVKTLIDKYEGLSIKFVVDGEESHNQNETKATQLKVNYKGIEYKVELQRICIHPFLLDDYHVVFEISEVGMDTILGTKETIVSALESIVNRK